MVGDTFDEGFEHGFQMALMHFKRRVEEIDLNEGSNQSLNALGMKLLILKILEEPRYQVYE